MKVYDYDGYKLELESEEIDMLVALLGYLSATHATTDLGKFMQELYSTLEGSSEPSEVNKYEQEFRAKAYGSDDDPSDFVILIKGADGEYK
ncbi:hypothetical protein VDTJJZMW_CDS_0179 [Pseudomonas phage LPS-5]|nr:hypothetical protein vFB297_1090 [Pseudomonas phage vFB297]